MFKLSFKDGTIIPKKVIHKTDHLVTLHSGYREEIHGRDHRYFDTQEAAEDCRRTQNKLSMQNHYVQLARLQKEADKYR